MAEKRGLGRGLSALLGEVEETPVAGGEAAGLRTVPIELIRRNEHQPRWTFPEAEIDELAASIRQKGVLQPILLRVSPNRAGEYEIVAGERRWRASQKAGLHELPAMIRELDDVQVLEIGVIENVQRAALNPIEEAAAYRALVETHNRTQEQVADAVGKSRSHVANAVRLLNLPKPVQTLVLDGKLSAGHARALLASDDPEKLAEQVLSRGLSVRETEALVRRAAAGEPPARSAPPRAVKDTDTQALEVDLSESLGLAVEVLHRNGAGEVRISYENLEQLDEICRRLNSRL